ncbi:MAG: hypothetical protein JXA71_02760 [Chitinispirillaceae bacterium]|nr:hypothetical protein [Chitinispirillaceae bacterium]
MTERVNYHRRTIVAVSAALVFFTGVPADNGTEALQLLPREKYKIILPKITVSNDYITGDFNGVRITFPESNDQVMIGTGNDMHIKNSPRGSDKTLYNESPEKACFLTKFEIKYISKVNDAFIQTLEEFDRLLQKQEWAKCRYLDSYFPNFLKGYYYFIGAAQNTSGALPRAARVPEKEYDVSQNSPKTDARVNQWQKRQEYVIKLRIASRELAHQLRAYQKIIDKTKGSEGIITPREMEEAMIIFIRIYFNLKPPSPVIMKNSRE